jgi:hypothetical protein
MQNDEDNLKTSPSSTPKNSLLRLRALWVGAVLYFLIVVNSFSYAYILPYQIVALAAIFNLVFMFTFIYAIRRIYLQTGRWLPF